LVLASAPGDPVKAAGPSFVISADGSKHYLAYGAGYGGIYLVELDQTTGIPISGFGNCIVRYSSDGTNQRVGFPEIIYNSSTHFYYCLATNEDGRVYGQNIEITRSAEITGPYLSYNGDNFTVGKADVDLWNMWHAVVPYAMLDSAKAVTSGWGNVGSPGVIKDGNNWFIVHNAKTLAVHKPISFEGYSTLHIRQLDWLPINSGWPVICPERYAGVQNDTLTSDDIVGEWDYNTLWYETYIQGINGEFWSGMMLNANNTISGTITGTWTFEPSTRLLTIISATWGNEQINLCVRRVKDWEYKITGTLPLTLAAAGVNNTFAQKPGVWMKKRPVVN
jgi:arabinan endo-1,5-alpha-L-arabinosidase